MYRAYMAAFDMSINFAISHTKTSHRLCSIHKLWIPHPFCAFTLVFLPVIDLPNVQDTGTNSGGYDGWI